ncbi:MAG: YebC/PmpR family DNA-binding transcriptional regulator [Deltaproteobacteria bacterium]|nr:YebC/PmpR family DNA-binding transcriptional regulator [Deltaproteobacteria bacterium]
MSGHSKWSTIKHKKGKEDARRGKIFTKLIKEITVAARMGGGDPNGNPRLRSAIQAAKIENMPKENIERAIKKGTGELPGVSYEEANFEGYGPGGVAILVEILSDNRKRTVAEIRHIFSKNAGNLGEAGCVSWMFDKKGLIVFEKGKVDEEKLMDLALEGGAQDVRETDKEYEVITGPADFEQVKKHLEAAKLIPTYAEISMVPQSTVRLTGKEAQQMLRLMESLEDSEDVQHVYANFDISDEELEQISA